MAGIASLKRMSELRTARQPRTASTCFWRPYVATRGRLAALTNATLLRAAHAGWKPHVRRRYMGSTVGMLAFESPTFARTIWPPLMTSSGRTPKSAGRYSTMSASLPTSSEPTTWLMPCVIAGLMVYLAT